MCQLGGRRRQLVGIRKLRVHLLRWPLLEGAALWCLVSGQDSLREVEM